MAGESLVVDACRHYSISLLFHYLPGYVCCVLIAQPPGKKDVCQTFSEFWPPYSPLHHPFGDGTNIYTTVFEPLGGRIYHFQGLECLGKINNSTCLRVSEFGLT